MKRWLSYIYKTGSSLADVSKMPEFAPNAPFYAIGDIHGSTALIRKILSKIEDPPSLCAAVVFLGDYVDRGEDSAGTLAQLYDLSQDDSRPWIFLRGNHEQMLLDFLDSPETAGPFWLMAGGRQTLASFGIGMPWQNMDTKNLPRVRDTLREKLGQDLEAWLRQMPLSWKTGNVFLSHAGTDPTLDLEAQSSDTLLWGKTRGKAGPRADGIWSVQGHVIVDTPQITNGQVFLDTGAYATGILTAARFDHGKVDFLST